MSDRRAALPVLVVGAALLVAAVALTIAFVTKDRAFIASTPQPTPLEFTTVVPVPGGEAGCVEGVTVTPRSDVAQFRIGTRGKPSVPVRATLTGPGGYRVETRIAAADWKDNDLLSARVRRPATPFHGRFCVTNEGRRVMDVYGANDRTESILPTTVAGREVDPNIQLTLLEATPATIAGRADELTERLSVFRPGIVGPWLLWPLAVLVVLGVPAGLTLAMRAAMRDDTP